MKMEKIAVLIPCYNEELTIEKVIKDFNDIESNLKKYTIGKKFKAENSRYMELFDKGFVSEGKEVTAQSNK